MNADLLERGYAELQKLIKAADDGSALGGNVYEELEQINDCRLALLEDGSPDAESFAVAISLTGVDILCQYRNPAEALKWLETAVQICQKYDGKEWVQRHAGAYGLMGEVYTRIADSSAAIGCFGKALAMADPEDYEFVVQARASLALALYNVPSRMGEARSLLESAAAAAEQSRNRWALALQLTNLASLCSQSGENRAALEYAERALAAAETDDAAGQLGALWSKANALYALGRTKEALQVYSQAMRLANTMQYERDLGRLQNDHGLAAADDGQFELAAECFNESLRRARDANDRSAVVVALTNMLKVAEMGGAASFTEQSWRDYLEAAEDCGIPRLQAAAHYNLGVRLRTDARTARQEFERGITLARSVNDRITERMGLVNLTMLALESGDQALTRRYADQMEALLPHLQDNPREHCEARLFLGVLYRDYWDPLKACEHLERGAQIAVGESDPRLLLKLLIDLGRAKQKLGNLDGAIATLAQADRLAQSAGDFLSASFALFNSGLCFVSQGKRGAAERSVADAIEAAKAGHSPHVGEYERVLQIIRNPWQWLGFSASAKGEAKAARALYGG